MRSALPSLHAHVGIFFDRLNLKRVCFTAAAGAYMFQQITRSFTDQKDESKEVTDQKDGSIEAERQIEDSYDIKEQIGKGTCGEVWRAIHKQTGAHWAVKIIETRRYVVFCIIAVSMVSPTILFQVKTASQFQKKHTAATRRSQCPARDKSLGHHRLEGNFSE